MSWDAFWAPHLVNWGLGLVSAAVSAVVGFLVRRWIRDILGQQQQTNLLAEEAAKQSKTAASSASAATVDASSAAEQSQATKDLQREANESVVWMAQLLGDTLEQNRALLARLDERQRAAPTTSAADGDTGGSTVTGRHRLHTQRIDTIPEGDRE